MDAHHLVEVKKNRNIPEFRAGDTVQVNYKVTEGERSRIQPFIGVVIRRTGGTSPAACFTVRHIARGFGVERTFPIYSPHLDSVEIQRYGKVRRAKLFYLRGLSGRAARIKELTVVPEWRKAGVILPPVEDVLELQEELEAEAVEEAAEETVAEEAAVDAVETTEAEVATDEPEASADEAPAEEPVAEVATKEPVAEAAAEVVADEAPADEVPADEPEETPAEEPVAEVATEEPVAESSAEKEPEAPEEEPKAPGVR